MSGEELKVTDAMNDAWVAYEPVHEYSENMKGHEVIAAIKHAFVSGYSARAHPLPEQPQEEDAAAQIASLKQRLESAGRLVEKGQNIVAVELRQLLESCCLIKDGEPIRETLDDGPSEIVIAMEGYLDAARTFLQEQEKQNG